MIEPPEGVLELASVVGVGIDVVDVDRFRAVLARRPGFGERVFTPAERAGSSGDAAVHLASRFAAKEAALKALGCGIFAVALNEIEVVGGGDAPPRLELGPEARRLAAERGVRHWLLSLSHERHVAAAIAVALG